MPDRNERNRRKRIKTELGNKKGDDFEISLPIKRELFKELFNYLDTNLSINSCDHTLKLTDQFLSKKKITNIPAVKVWLGDKSAHCDCEVLSNVEELFE